MGGEAPDMGGGLSSPPEPAGGEAAPPPAAGGVTPETFKRNDLDLILERTLFNSNNVLDLSKGRVSINEIEAQIKQLLNK